MTESHRDDQRSFDLSEVPFFEELDDDLRRKLEERMVEREYSAGEVVFERGDEGLGLYVIFGGELAILGPGDRLLARLGRGELLGEMALLDGGARSATARATEATRCGLLSREDVLPLLRSEPHLALELVALVARRVRSGMAVGESGDDGSGSAWGRARGPLLAAVAAATLGEAAFRVMRESLETLLGEMRDGEAPRDAAKEALEVALLEGLRTPRQAIRAVLDRLDPLAREQDEEDEEDDESCDEASE